jgi:hypothetical protein
VKRIIFSGAAIGLVLGLAWVGGFDFNERGVMAFGVSALALWIGAWAYYLADESK